MLFFQIAVWNSYTGLNLTEQSRVQNQNVTDSLANRTLIVTTILVRGGWEGEQGERRERKEDKREEGKNTDIQNVYAI